MKRLSASVGLALLVCAALPAATTNTTLTVNATAKAAADLSFVIAGSANFTGGIGNGTIAATIAASAIGGDPVKTPFTITLASGGTLTGTLSVPQSLLFSGATTGSGTVTLAVTGGSGTYSGATGTFTLSGSVSGSLVTGFDLKDFSGSGTITTGGTTGGGGGTGGGTTPTITDVLDAASYTKTIAQGSIFVVKGTNLSASGFSQFGFPLPNSSNGVKITFTPAGGGTGTDAYLVYLYNQGGVNQLAAILPSTVAPGNYNVTVTNGTASAGFATQVVQRKIGIITQDSTGSGLAVVQNYISAAQLDVDRFTVGTVSGVTISPARPGQVLIAWATGMGPVTGGDNTASPGFDFNANGVNVKVIVGGTSITPLYAGRAPGLAGADQINFTLPTDTPTGCTVPFQVSVNGVLSNPTFIAIAPNASADACTMPGFTSDQLKKFDTGGTYTVGSFSISQFTITVPSVGTVKSNSIGGGFSRLTGFQLSSAGQVNPAVIQSGSCQVYHSTSSGATATPTGSLTYLDAGTVSINGPAGSSLSNQALTKTNNIYSYSSFEGLGVSIPGQANFSLPAGTYTLSGAGGPDVGSFSTSLTLGSPLVVTGGLPATVNRGAGLTLNWTGGNASDLVEIIGSSSTTTGTGSSTVTDATTFICTTTAGQKTFTVPASILTALPASTATNPGVLELASGSFSSTFTATLPKAGGSIDAGLFISLLGVGATPTYQ